MGNLWGNLGGGVVGIPKQIFEHFGGDFLVLRGLVEGIEDWEEGVGFWGWGMGGGLHLSCAPPPTPSP